MSLRVAQAIAAKDLRTEMRSRSAVGTVLPFAVTMLLAFGFALGPDRLLLAQTAPALLWLAALFASVELCHRSYQHEAANGALEGLLLSPVDKGAVFLGKAAAVFLQLIVLLVMTTGIVIGQPPRPACRTQPYPAGRAACPRSPPGQPRDHRGNPGDGRPHARHHRRDRRVAEPARGVRRRLPRRRLHRVRSSARGLSRLAPWALTASPTGEHPSKYTIVGDRR